MKRGVRYSLTGWAVGRRYYRNTRTFEAFFRRGRKRLIERQSDGALIRFRKYKLYQIRILDMFSRSPLIKKGGIFGRYMYTKMTRAK